MKDWTYRTDLVLMDPIKIGRYSVEFYTRERYWAGGGTQDWPGTFMDNCMYLIACKDPTPKETEALKKRKAVFHWHDEITNQLEGYSEFVHNSIMKNPDKYIDQIAKGIHEDVDSWIPSYKEMKKDLEKYNRRHPSK